MSAEDGRETFRSEVIDLGNMDFSALGTIPNPVLRAAVRRVCRELAGNEDASAYFQSSLRGGSLDDEEAGIDDA
jgi:FXSXX-COOH protein